MMQTLKLLKSSHIRSLHGTIASNLERYRTGTFPELLADFSKFIELPQEVDEAVMAVVACDDPEDDETSNCLRVRNALPSISPFLARDSRLWVMLTHTMLLNYTRKRWPIPTDADAAVRHITKHFFAIGTRGFERDNAASRLWWMAELCRRIDGITLEAALKSFTYRADVRANIFERPTTSQCAPVFSAIIKRLCGSYAGDQRLFEREAFRASMKRVNALGGLKLLNALDETEIETVLDACLSG